MPLKPEIYAAPARELRRVASAVRSLDYSASAPQLRPAHKARAIADLKEIISTLETMP